MNLLVGPSNKNTDESLLKTEEWKEKSQNACILINYGTLAKNSFLQLIFSDWGLIYQDKF